jgi:hypothetical protein
LRPENSKPRPASDVGGAASSQQNENRSMQKNDTTPMTPEKQQEEAYLDMVYRIMPGARQVDAHNDWLHDLNESSSLFVIPAHYTDKLTRDLGHAVALAAGLNPDHPFVEISRIREWDTQHQRQLRSPKPNSVITSPFASARLLVFLELFDLALCDIEARTLPARKQDGRSGGYVVKAGEFTQWVAKSGVTLPRSFPAVTASKNPEVPANLPVDVPTNAGAVVRKSSKKQGNILDPVIDLAQSKCHDSRDAAEVWAQLVRLAEEEHPPLIGLFKDRLKYNGSDKQPGFLGLAAFRKRMAIRNERTL